MRQRPSVSPYANLRGRTRACSRAAGLGCQAAPSAARPAPERLCEEVQGLHVRLRQSVRAGSREKAGRVRTSIQVLGGWCVLLKRTVSCWGRREGPWLPAPHSTRSLRAQ